MKSGFIAQRSGDFQRGLAQGVAQVLHGARVAAGLPEGEFPQRVCVLAQRHGHFGQAFVVHFGQPQDRGGNF